jgi:hypothetical protein
VVLPLAALLVAAPVAAAVRTHHDEAASTIPSAVTSTPPQVVLGGPSNREQKGFGHVKPSTVYLGGVESGLVQHIHWQSWGGARATGTGVGWYVGPGQSDAGGSEQSATIVAFALGQCGGRRAYDAVEWYFPQHGEHFNSGPHINACGHLPSAAEEQAARKRSEAEGKAAEEVGAAVQNAEKTGSPVACERVVARVHHSNGYICRWAAERAH